MQGASWITLFRRIPANLHDGVILTMTTGGEVVVQKLIKLDADVVILRGRMAGTQDSGRIIILPYTQLMAINFTRRLSEKDVTAIFGNNTQAFAADFALTAPTEEEAADLADADAGAENAVASDKPASGKAQPAKPHAGKPGLPSKAELLAKLRSRLG